MKRKLISYDVFERIQSDSLSKAQKELTESEQILATTLGLNEVKLHCYGVEDVLFESSDGTYIHANYTVSNNQLTFDNVEELVLNEADEQKIGKDTIREMVDAILEKNDAKAGSLFNEYVNLPGTKRILRESVFKKNILEGKKKCGTKCAAKCSKSMMCSDVTRPKVNEWNALAETVSDYLKYQHLSPILSNSSANRDNNGNLVSLAIPTEKARNEAKLLKLTYKNMLDTELKVLRGKGKTLAETMSFCKAMADVKRQNQLSDNDGLQETLENVVSKWPQVLFLTQNELSEQIKHALRTVGATNYDDSTCDFMSEGILRVAHDAYTDKVNKLVSIAGADICQDCDQYEEFQNVMGQFYTTLDENTKREMDVYVDLYNAFREIHSLAAKEGNNELKLETARYLSDLSGVVKGELNSDIELVQSAGSWLAAFVETNLAGHEWKVSSTVRNTINGDVPEMAEKARQGYTPAKDFSGDWGDEAPVSDGKSYRNGLAGEMRGNSWSQQGGNEVWPSLQNPYIPKSFGDYKIKGETPVASDTGSVEFQSKDTWPNLQNPYIPDSLCPQMKSDDLVVDA